MISDSHCHHRYLDQFKVAITLLVCGPIHFQLHSHNAVVSMHIEQCSSLFGDHVTKSRATVTPPGKWLLAHLVSSSCAKEPSQPAIGSIVIHGHGRHTEKGRDVIDYTHYWKGNRQPDLNRNAKRDINNTGGMAKI